MAETPRSHETRERRATAEAAQDAIFERTLRRTPAQRLSDAARVARFVLRGREKLRAVRDGNR